MATRCCGESRVSEVVVDRFDGTISSRDSRVLLSGVKHVDDVDLVVNLIDHNVVCRDHQFPSALFTTAPACEWESWEAVHRSLYG